MQQVQLPICGLPLTLIITDALEAAIVLMDRSSHILDLDLENSGRPTAHICPDDITITWKNWTEHYSYSTLYELDGPLLAWLRAQNLINPYQGA